MSRKFPHDRWTLLPLVSRENDSPRCAGQVWGRVRDLQRLECGCLLSVSPIED